VGKHEVSYPRVHRDHYPTPQWVVEALAAHVDLTGLTIWEPAAGNGRMAEALKQAGAARVYCSDVASYGYPLDAIADFLGCAESPLRCDMIVTNPPFGQRGKTAEAFIEAGLRQIPSGASLALLLPADFDSAKTRMRFFAGCRHFAAKIILTRRVVWFERPDGKRENPKENTAWFVWTRTALQWLRYPVILYAANSGTAWGTAWEKTAPHAV
jgi:hypothetical protein